MSGLFQATESPKIADWLLERGGFEPPEPQGLT
jgi:hypothetical protein